MKGQYYKGVEINKDGNSTEPVNYVGVYPLIWRDIVGKYEEPEMGFVEVDFREELIKFAIYMAKESGSVAYSGDLFPTLTGMIVDEYLKTLEK